MTPPRPLCHPSPLCASLPTARCRSPLPLDASVRGAATLSRCAAGSMSRDSASASDRSSGGSTSSADAAQETLLDKAYFDSHHMGRHAEGSVAALDAATYYCLEQLQDFDTLDELNRQIPGLAPSVAFHLFKQASGQHAHTHRLQLPNLLNVDRSVLTMKTSPLSASGVFHSPRPPCCNAATCGAATSSTDSGSNGRDGCRYGTTQLRSTVLRAGSSLLTLYSSLLFSSLLFSSLLSFLSLQALPNWLATFSASGRSLAGCGQVSRVERFSRSAKGRLVTSRCTYSDRTDCVTVCMSGPATASCTRSYSRGWMMQIQNTSSAGKEYWLLAIRASAR